MIVKAKGGREPPDDRLEWDLIGCILVDGGQIPKVVALGLRPEHFRNQAAALAYTHAGAVLETHGVTDVSLVIHSITESGDLDEIGADVLYQAASNVPSPSHAPFYALELLKRWVRNQTEIAHREGLRRLEHHDDPADVRLSTQARLEEIDREAATAGQFPFVDVTKYLTEEAPAPKPIWRGFLDHGDKLLTFAESKIGKSFHAQQGCLSLAAGLPFLGMEPEGRKSVLYINYEIQPRHCWKRFSVLGDHLGIGPEDIGDRLQVLNARGSPPPLTILHLPFDLIVLDPWYKVLASLGRDENDPKDVGATLSEIDAAMRHTSPAVWIIHHTTKGSAGDRSLLDRGAGSGKLARDLDACFSLAKHRDEERAVVIESVSRNYPAAEPLVVEWDGCFVRRPDLDPVIETSLTAANKRQKAKGPSIEEMAEIIGKTISGPEETGDVKKRIRRKFDTGKNRTDSVVKALEDCGFVRWRAGFPSVSMIGPEGCQP